MTSLQPRDAPTAEIFAHHLLHDEQYAPDQQQQQQQPTRRHSPHTANTTARRPSPVATGGTQNPSPTRRSSRHLKDNYISPVKPQGAKKLSNDVMQGLRSSPSVSPKEGPNNNVSPKQRVSPRQGLSPKGRRSNRHLKDNYISPVAPEEAKKLKNRMDASSNGSPYAIPYL